MVKYTTSDLTREEVKAPIMVRMIDIFIKAIFGNNNERRMLIKKVRHHRTPIYRVLHIPDVCFKTNKKSSNKGSKAIVAVKQGSSIRAY